MVNIHEQVSHHVTHTYTLEGPAQPLTNPAAAPRAISPKPVARSYSTYSTNLVCLRRSLASTSLGGISQSLGRLPECC